MKTTFAGLLFALFCATVAAEQPSLNCEIGPAKKTFGGSAWLVYGCDDQHSVVAVTDSGSPAFPFYFMFAYKDGAYRLYGEGTGNKTATDAAYKELSLLKPAEISALFKEASRSSKK